MSCLAFCKPLLVRGQTAPVPCGYRELNPTLDADAVELEGPVHAHQKPKTVPGRFPDSKDRAQAPQRVLCAQ